MKKDFGYNTDCCCLTDREINQILMKENQALKDKWNELKKFVDNQANNYDEDICSVCCLIYDKMQELEKGEKR